MIATYASFKPFTTLLLQSSTREEEVAVAQSLTSLYHELLAQCASTVHYTNTEPTHVDGGIALSSQHALDCLQDPLRTIRFIKGTYQAIRDAQSIYKDTRIELVYAGCGPGAPIIMPLLSMFSSEELAITLLDINQSSITSVEALIDTLDANAYFRKSYLGDAIEYSHDATLPLHIVVSETMDKGLTKEPQIRITQNLANQLDDNGIFIPESIDLYAEHSFYSNEPYFDIYKNVLALEPPIETQGTIKLFSITKDIAATPIFQYLSPPIEVPENSIETPDISLFAEVYIYKDQKLLKAESLISNPFCLISLYNLNSKAYQLQHSTRDIPHWECLPVST